MELSGFKPEFRVFLSELKPESLEILEFYKELWNIQYIFAFLKNIVFFSAKKLRKCILTILLYGV